MKQSAGVRRIWQNCVWPTLSSLMRLPRWTFVATNSKCSSVVSKARRNKNRCRRIAQFPATHFRWTDYRSGGFFWEVRRQNQAVALHQSFGKRVENSESQILIRCGTFLKGSRPFVCSLCHGDLMPAWHSLFKTMCRR